MKFCTHCGNELMDEAILCPKCGCGVAGASIPGQEKKATTPESRKHLVDLLTMVDFVLCGFLLVLSTILTIWASFISGFVLNVISMVFVLPLIALSILSFTFSEKNAKDRYSFVSRLSISGFMFIHFFLWMIMVAVNL